MEEKITELIDGCLLYFKKHSYSSNRIKVYESLWKNGIIPFMTQQGLTVFTPEVSQWFIESITSHEDITSQVREKIRSVHVLEDYLTLGYVRKRRTVPVQHPLEGEIGELMQKHIRHLYNLRRSKITIRRNLVYMHRFLTYLNMHNVGSVEEIRDQHVIGFLSTPETNNPHVIGALRVLFNFWKDKDLSKRNLADCLEFLKPRKREKIPSYYAQKEISVFEESIDRYSGLGKRNYAIFLLASRLGLRASDIVGLQFSNLDWENNEIRLRQYKTGKPTNLPLLAEVGNAIIDYLKNGRPISKSQYIFLCHRPPYDNATARTISTAISRIIVKSGIPLHDRRHGSHSLRHSLASLLLEQEVALPVISEVLGHSTSQTTMKYLRIDIALLMKCAIPVPAIPDDFYTQKGGVFYE